jgi:hypothetical protein
MKLNAATARPKIGKWMVWVFGAVAAALIGIWVTDTYDWIRPKDHRTFRILIPLYATEQEFLNYLKSDGKYPENSYTRKVSIDIINTVNATADAWFSKHPDQNRNRVELFFFPEGTNPEQYELALQKALDTEAVVIGSIGHVTSSVSAAYGKLYAKHRIPLILPLATATNLPHYLTSTTKVPAVLRLPPSNEKQAAVISSFLLNKYSRGPSAVLVRDLSNPTYSNDLVESFRVGFTRQPFRNAESLSGNAVDSVNHGRILATFPTGDVSDPPILNPVIERLRPDALLLFGMTEPSLEALIQMKASQLHPTDVFFTDGAVDEYLLPRLRRLMRDAPPESAPSFGNGRIYMTFPSENPKLPQFLIDELQPEVAKNLELTHGRYVSDAVQIFLWAVHHKIISDRSTAANEIVIRMLLDWQTNEPKGGKIRGVDFLEPRTYLLDESGSSQNLNYHIFFSTLPGLTPWAHARNDCPASHNGDDRVASTTGS